MRVGRASQKSHGVVGV